MLFKNRYGETVSGSMPDFNKELDYVLHHGVQERPKVKSSEGHTLMDAQRKFREQTGSEWIADTRTQEQKLADAIGEEVHRQVKPLVNEIRQSQVAHQAAKTESVKHEAPRVSILDMIESGKRLMEQQGLVIVNGTIVKKDSVNQAAKANQFQTVTHSAQGKFSHAIGPVMTTCCLKK